jgi:hypothetical protein
MNKIILAVFLLGCSAAVGNATVLSFDDTSFSHEPSLISNGYGGLNWNNMYVENTDFATEIFGANGYTNGRVSGKNVAFNGNGDKASVSTGTFNFIGAYLTAAWNNNLTIDVQGWKSGVKLYDKQVVVNADAATYFNFNYRGIDSLDFNSYGGTSAGYISYYSDTQFAMDDFTFNQNSSDSVPEPSTFLLFGAGFAGVGFLRNRMRN